MKRHHSPTNSPPEPPWTHRRTPPALLSLLLAVAVPATVYLLTHPLAAALLVGLAAGRLSGPFGARLRALADRTDLARTLARPPRRAAAAVRSSD